MKELLKMKKYKIIEILLIIIMAFTIFFTILTGFGFFKNSIPNLPSNLEEGKKEWELLNIFGWMGDGVSINKVKISDETIENIKNNPLWNKPGETSENKEEAIQELKDNYSEKPILENIDSNYWKFEDRTNYLDEDKEIIVRNFIFSFTDMDNNCKYIFEYNS